MKKALIGTMMAVLVIGTAAFALAGPYGPGMHVQQAQASGGGWGYGPMHMGPKMGMGSGMGMGMMGWGHGPGMAGSMPCGGWQRAGFTTPAAQPLTKDNASQILQSYVARTGNPNLKLGDVTETATAFEGKVVTKEGSLVQTLLIDKATGWVQQGF